MKKSLIALAALATVATAAQAQSSVTLYGILDASVAKTTGAGTADTSYQGVASGALSSSRWGVRGAEDIGGGTKANFNLESEIALDTGVGGSTTQVSGGANSTGVNLFNRAANVGLEQNGLGSITLGRKNRLDYDTIVSLDPFGGANVGGVTRVGYIGGGLLQNADARLSDSVTLQTAPYAGVSLAIQQQFGEQSANNTKHRTTVYGGSYKVGKLYVAANYSKAEGASSSEQNKTTLYGATYDFGVAKAFVGHAEREVNGVSPKTKLDFVGVVVPVAAKVNLIANYISLKNTVNANVSGADVKVPTDGQKADAYGLGVTYSLSNRTTAYALYGNVDNQGGALVPSASIMGSSANPGANKQSATTAVGVRHSF